MIPLNYIFSYSGHSWGLDQYPYTYIVKDFVKRNLGNGRSRAVHSTSLVQEQFIVLDYSSTIEQDDAVFVLLEDVAQQEHVRLSINNENAFLNGSMNPVVRDKRLARVLSAHGYVCFEISVKFIVQDLDYGSLACQKALVKVV